MIHVGSCLEVMPTMQAGSVDAIVCDPPYGLGFMGKGWDHAVPGADFWREALRVAKPGAHLVAFGGARTFHRLACAIEDAGWELRDTLMWVYGSGFPKSHDVSKAIDREAGAERKLTRPGIVQRDGYGGDWDTGDSDHRPRFDEPATQAARDWQGWGTALKPAWEPIILARKPLVGTVAANVQAHGTGGLNIDRCRVEAQGRPRIEAGNSQSVNTFGGGLNGSRAAGSTDLGRWPANLLHDGSDDVLAAFPNAQGQSGMVTGNEPTANGFSGNMYGSGGIAQRATSTPRGDAGSAARFFYCAKADREDRNDGCDGMEAGKVHGPSGDGRCWDIPGSKSTPRANNHPTVKPTDLMRWLCRLVTPPGGLVLDPFTGSGSTGRGAVAEGFQFVGIELSPEYAAIAEARIRAMQPGLSFGAAA